MHQIDEVQNRLSPTPDATPQAHDARLAHYLADAVDDDRDAWGDAQRRTFAVEPAVAGADDPEGNAAQRTC
ncbi:hypothetical protein [Streptomyces atratus]|uniref:Uncharacterized protein n=1 Tax=Streptomyces atratus TaxID=1893 RepID=A0A2Z5J7Q5_STRAR|nr:hypothetical protein [Streptomyces atratus]AXE76320.1 hypothetical protein C5746_04410 [Streptomyces atratus]